MNRRAALVGALLLAVSTLAAQTGSVRIRVTDPLGAVVPAASASLLDADSRPVRTMAANDAGEILWPQLPLGDSHFWVSAPGFSLFMVNASIRDGVEQNMGVALKVGCIECVVDLATWYAPNSDTLDLIPELTPSPPQPKPAKRQWWQIFR